MGKGGIGGYIPTVVTILTILTIPTIHTIHIGAGKSFTMIGAADMANCINDAGEFDHLAGITPRAVSEIFRLLTERNAQYDFNVDVQVIL